MSLINISNLTFAYEGSYDNIFENVSFQIDSKWKLGLIGRNGRGKTTFLNLLLNKYDYKGTISHNINFEYFPFVICDKEKLTIDIINEIIPHHELWAINKELSHLEVNNDVLYQQFNLLSNGEQIKILLAILFLKEKSFLLIDEPTNHLDINARKIVSNYLKSKKGFILVSHDRVFLDNCVDHILSINKTNIEIQKGNFSSWFQNKQQQDNLEIAQNKKLKSEINRLKSASQRTSNWSDKVEKTKYGTKTGGLKPDRGYIGHKAAKMMKRSKSIESRQSLAIEEKSKLLKNIENVDELKISPLPYHSKKLIDLKNVSLAYNEKIICKNINFSVDEDDRIAICGKNGSGKSSLLKLIYGEHISFSGDFKKGSNLVISYVSQDTSFLKGNLSDFAKNNNIDESLFKSILRKLDFGRLQFEKDISTFSSGQKKKVVIAKSLSEKANLYIWDEPLNFIDIFSRIQIEELILKFKPTILFVEHDQSFINNIATKVITLDDKN